MPTTTTALARTEEIERLLGKLTLEEKVRLLDGRDFWHTHGIDRLGVPAVTLSDGPHGLRKERQGSQIAGETVPATCFPTASGIACSWDPNLLLRVGEAIAREALAEDVAVVLGPGVNIKRTPLCGRNFEYFSEDPLLSGTLAAAWVRGVQSQGVGASLKHFAANNQETERMTVSAEVDERTLREIYLPAFEHAVVTAQPWTVMSAYNRINGVYASEDPWLLTQVLRHDWGFEGLVLSDWGAVDSPVASLAAGLDLQMPSSNGSGPQAILAAVEQGLVIEADVDRAAGRVLALVSRSQVSRGASPAFDQEQHHQLARQAATASAVLLKNDGGLLPLDPSAGGHIAVIGAFARTPRYQGAGSSRVNPTRLDDSWTALRDGLSGRAASFAPGFTLDDEESDPALLTEAVELARGAEVVLLFLGLPDSCEMEGADRRDLDLPAQQVAVLEAVSAVNPNVAVVLSNGSAVVMPWRDRAVAILEAWLPGQAGGTAIADLLLGRAVPGGKLAETIPLRLLDTPAVGAWPGEHGRVHYREGLLVGYRWYDTRDLEVAYPFGHGLSYTSFEFSEATLTIRDAALALVDVSVTVTNTGARAGQETVQVYVADPVSEVFRPAQELKGFAKVSLAPGASTVVTVSLEARAFSWWHSELQRWVVEGGEFEIRVGASSRDIRAVLPVSLPGEALVPELTAGTPLGRWLEHPTGGTALQERFEGSPYAAVLTHPELGHMLLAIPIRRLCRFPGFPVTEQELPHLARQANELPTTEGDSG